MSIEFPHPDPMEEIENLRHELGIAMIEGHKLQDFTRAKNIRVVLERKMFELKKIIDPWQYQWRRDFVKEYGYRYIGIPNDFGLMIAEVYKGHWCVMNSNHDKFSPIYNKKPIVGQNSFVTSESTTMETLRNGDFSEFNTNFRLGFARPFYDDWACVYYFDNQAGTTLQDYIDRNGNLLGKKLDARVNCENFHNRYATINFPGGRVRTRLLELDSDNHVIQSHDLIGFKPGSDFEEGFMVVSNKSGFTFMDTELKAKPNYLDFLTPLINGVAFALKDMRVYRVNQNLDILDFVCKSYSSKIITRGEIFGVFNKNRAHDLYNSRGELLIQNTYQVKNVGEGILHLVNKKEYYIDFTGKEIFS